MYHLNGSSMLYSMQSEWPGRELVSALRPREPPDQQQGYNTCKGLPVSRKNVQAIVLPSSDVVTIYSLSKKVTWIT